MQDFQNDLERILNDIKDFGSHETQVMENVLSNLSEVKNDIETVEKSFESKDFGGVGNGLGDLLRVAFAESEETVSEFTFDPKIVGEDILLFVEGFADGLVNASIETDLATCWKDTTLTMDDLKTAIDDFKKKTESGIVAGLKELVVVQQQIKAAVQPCTASYTDLKTLVTDIETVVSEIESGKILVKVGKNIIVNGVDIFKQVVALVEDAEKADQKGIGLELGDIARELLINKQ